MWVAGTPTPARPGASRLPASPPGTRHASPGAVPLMTVPLGWWPRTVAQPARGSAVPRRSRPLAQIYSPWRGWPGPGDKAGAINPPAGEALPCQGVARRHAWLLAVGNPAFGIPGGTPKSRQRGAAAPGTPCLLRAGAERQGAERRGFAACTGLVWGQKGHGDPQPSSLCSPCPRPPREPCGAGSCPASPPAGPRLLRGVSRCRKH